MPEPVTNNAVVVLQKNDKDIIYSFYGLDSTKQWSGVNRKVFRVDLTNKNSELLGLVPDTLGRLASMASVLKNKVYLVGGYAVFADGKEKSSSHLFIFDPQTESFSSGADLPVPIDDHIQSTWRDSLLYVITGWSDSVNVNTVQVYNPATNTWQLATPLPDVEQAKVFGGSGIIVGDTIYMLGGAMFEKFYPPSRRMFKGVIDQNNPTEINWIDAGDYPGEYRYRSAAFTENDVIHFFGGSNETYNYNAIAYESKRPVEANTETLRYHIQTGNFSLQPAVTQRMDLRNVVQIGDQVYVVGGIEARQRVSNRISKIN